MTEVKTAYQIPSQIDASVFRAYDIRGNAETKLTPNLVYALGLAIAAEAQDLGQSNMAVGRDGRLSSPALSKALISGLCAGGVNVLDIGICPSPVLYYATYSLGTQAGVIVTGSHNPKQDNGLKIVLGDKTLCGEQIKRLYQRVIAGNLALSPSPGQVTQCNVIPSYIERIVTQLHSLEPKYKVVVDCGHGVVSVLAVDFFQQLGCEVIPLYCEIDGHFPAHHPDPTRPENLEDIIAAVKTHQADIGFAFDGDGDRIVSIANDGQVIWPESMMMLFAQDVLQNKPNSPIVFDVKCSNALADVITEAGGNPVMTKTGHSLLKQHMRDVSAPLAGELSGHIFFADQWYGFDDGPYAAARFLNLMRQQGKSSAALLATLPKRISTQELQVLIPEADKAQIMVQITAQFKALDSWSLCLIDGVRASTDYGWGLVRASNTTPCLTCRFEADTEDDLLTIQEHFHQLIRQASSKAKIPF